MTGDSPFPDAASFIRYHLAEGFSVYEGVCNRCGNESLHRYTAPYGQCVLHRCAECGNRDWKFTELKQYP